ncbi:MAG: DCC1-like thiol-disulfide oxidoreductase family protein [Gemmatimonadota bacterium]
MSRSRAVSSPPRRANAPSLQARLDEFGYILLFDGTCGLCSRAVQWVLRRDPGGRMRFAPLESTLGRAALGRLPALEGVDSMVLLHREGAWIKSTAALEIARYVGGLWGMGVVGYLLPRALRDWMYDQVAKRRTAIWGRTNQCMLPSPDERERFYLD